MTQTKSVWFYKIFSLSLSHLKLNSYPLQVFTDDPKMLTSHMKKVFQWKVKKAMGEQFWNLGNLTYMFDLDLLTPECTPCMGKENTQ